MRRAAAGKVLVVAHMRKGIKLSAIVRDRVVILGIESVS